MDRYPHPTDLAARIKRTEQRMDQSESRAEYEANRQVLIWLRSLLDKRVSA